MCLTQYAYAVDSGARYGLVDGHVLSTPSLNKIGPGSRAQSMPSPHARTHVRVGQNRLIFFFDAVSVLASLGVFEEEAMITAVHS